MSFNITETPTHVFTTHIEVVEYLERLKKSGKCLRNHKFHINNKLKKLYFNPKDQHIKKIFKDNKLTITCYIKGTIHDITIDKWDECDELEEKQLLDMLNSISDTNFNIICQLYGISSLIEKSQKITELLDLEDEKTPISENIYKLTTQQLKSIWDIFISWEYITKPITNPTTKTEYITELLKLYSIPINTDKIIEDKLLQYENSFVFLDTQDIYIDTESDIAPLLGIRNRKNNTF